MNCPLRADDGDGREGWNQNPNLLDGTTRQDLNGLANARVLRRTQSHEPTLDKPDDATQQRRPNSLAEASSGQAPSGSGAARHVTCSSFFTKCLRAITTFGKFVGPGIMVSVAYIDPGNYSTDISAGANFRFQLLFIVLWANIAAIVLQSLCIKLGTITGMNLAELCRAQFPWWLNIILYIFAEVAIIATDVAEVIGTAIAINLLIPKIPLVAGCILSVLDVLLILAFYRPHGPMSGLRAFEFFVMALVLGVVICFCIQLSLIQDTTVGEVFRGYLPSAVVFRSKGLYEACGILGATVMPHSLYLGSGIVQPRLLEYDVKNGHVESDPRGSFSLTHSSEKDIYRPSLPAVKHCLKYSIVELTISLSVFALFVNSAILIVSGASLSSLPDVSSASLFSIHDLLSTSLAPAAGTILALALLLSGISAGIVCTISGQMVSEGCLNWTIAPWLRRLITRCISIAPSIVVAGAVGRDGLSVALNASQVILSVILPFVSAPVIYFTCRNKYMTVKVRRDVSPALQNSSTDEQGVGEREHGDSGSERMEAPVQSLPAGAEQESGESGIESVGMRNHYILTAAAVLIWIMIAAMNIANLVFLGLGDQDDG